ncbi:hypothetical protein QE436_003335 [Pantoea anthophila]|nr:hypothetical protein [Pantoea anthophila]
MLKKLITFIIVIIIEMAVIFWLLPAQLAHL